MRSSDQWERAMREANISTDGLSRVIGKGEIRMDNDELLTGREAEEQQTADLVEVVRCKSCTRRHAAAAEAQGADGHGPDPDPTEYEEPNGVCPI